MVSTGNQAQDKSAENEKYVQEITVDANFDQIDPVTEFVNARLTALGCSDRIRVQVDIAIDEIFSNIAKYAYSPQTGPATVRVDVDDDPLSVIITFIDHGMPYDPIATEHPDTTRLPADQRPIGGLGLFIVQKTMDDISYTYHEGQNILTIHKKI